MKRWLDFKIVCSAVRKSPNFSLRLQPLCSFFPLWFHYLALEGSMRTFMFPMFLTTLKVYLQQSLWSGKRGSHHNSVADGKLRGDAVLAKSRHVCNPFEHDLWCSHSIVTSQCACCSEVPADHWCSFLSEPRTLIFIDLGTSAWGSLRADIRQQMGLSTMVPEPDCKFLSPLRFSHDSWQSTLSVI